jgi:hypothetical protein
MLPPPLEHSANYRGRLACPAICHGRNLLLTHPQSVGDATYMAPCNGPHARDIPLTQRGAQPCAGNPTRAPFHLTQRGAQLCACNPTRVGWRLSERRAGVGASVFRPHARGVERFNETNCSEPTHFRPHARGVEIMEQSWTGCYLDFRPHARGVEINVAVESRID